MPQSDDGEDEYVPSGGEDEAIVIEQASGSNKRKLSGGAQAEKRSKPGQDTKPAKARGRPAASELAAALNSAVSKEKMKAKSFAAVKSSAMAHLKRGGVVDLTASPRPRPGSPTLGAAAGGAATATGVSAVKRRLPRSKSNKSRGGGGGGGGGGAVRGTAEKEGPPSEKDAADAFHRALLNWDLSETGTKLTQAAMAAALKDGVIPDKFESVKDYQAAWMPLCVQETHAQALNAVRHAHTHTHTHARAHTLTAHGWSGGGPALLPPRRQRHTNGARRGGTAGGRYRPARPARRSPYG